MYVDSIRVKFLLAFYIHEYYSSSWRKNCSPATWYEMKTNTELYSPYPSTTNKMWQSKAGLKSIFFLPTGCLTKAKELSLPYHLLMRRSRALAGHLLMRRRRSRALAQREMQTVSSKIWTQVADFISSDDNCCIKHCSFLILNCSPENLSP